jgi:putative transposase
MCLRFVYLLVVSGFSWLQLAARGGAWKDTELLLLRHQLRVLQRQQARKPRLTRADRALIAALARVIPKARQAGLRLVVTPDTVMRWHRDLLRRRWAAKSRAGCSGRPVIRRGIRRLVLRLARENQAWGYRRIHGELAGMGIRIAPSTVWKILTRAGIAPRANAIMERWIGSCRGEILDRTLIWNLPHLRRVLAEYEDHYNRHRPHRTRQHASPLRGLPEPANLDHLNVQRRDRLGGIINEYTQVA